MADYPDIDISFQSTRDTDGGVLLSYSPNGTPFTQSHYDNSWFNFRLIHPLIPSAEKNTLEAFYEANKNVAFTLNPYQKDGQVYINCRFMPTGMQSQRVAADYWNVVAEFRGEKQ